MHDKRRWVLGAWAAFVVVVFGLGGILGNGFTSKFSAPGDSKKGFDVLSKNFEGVGGGQDGTVVFRSPRGFQEPTVTAAITEFIAKASAEQDLIVRTPLGPFGAGQISRVGPDAGKIAFASLAFTHNVPQERGIAIGKNLRRYANETIVKQAPDVQVEIGGQNFAGFKAPSSETIGLAFAIIVLIISFGSVLAMGLPIGTAVAGIGVGLGLAGLMSKLIPIPTFSTSLGAMIGLGVGIDYALFIVSRYREETAKGRSSSDATARAMDTAGRSVIFAGITVVISLLGMLVMGLTFVRGLAISAATVVAVTLLASLTLLPALLGFAAHRVEVTRWRGLIAASLVAVGLALVGLKITLGVVLFPIAAVVIVVGLFLPMLKKEVPKRAPKPVERTFAHRWSRQVQRHPVIMVVVSLIVLLGLSIPVLSLRLGFSDESNLAKSTTTRKAYDMLAQGFGPGFNGPILAVTELPAGIDSAKVGAIGEAMRADRGVAVVQGPVPSRVAGAAALWVVFPKTAPQDAATTATIRRLRADVIPAATAGTTIHPYLTGFTTVSVDFSDYIAARLPVFFGAVLVLSFLLLMGVFRSVLVPLKAVIMNMLSIGASYGICVMVFQWGFGRSILGIEKAPIVPFMPMMLFAILFGLSMDYEVFLLSRVKEEYDRTGDNARAVADGLAATARLITAAAAIMVVVFGSFLLEADRVIKLFGLGLASAILLDATIVRMVLVPATMELLGDRNWWLPAWLGKLIPRIDVEGHHDEIDIAHAAAAARV